MSDVVTLNVTLAVLVWPPSVPLMIRLYVPVGVEALVLMVTVEEPEPLIEGGLKLAVAPEGRPLMLRLTGLLSPDIALTVAVKLVASP